MIYQYVKRYLKKAFKEPRADQEWSNLDNLQFFTVVKKRYTLEEFEKEIGEVKVAFKDFFEPVGNIVFRYKEEAGVKFKIFPYRVKPSDSKHLKNIVKIILNNKKYIQFGFQGHEDQIVISGKIRREVNKELFQTQESVKVKDLIAYAIQVALKLSDKDIITQLKRKYLIKLFNKNVVLNIEEEVITPTKTEVKSSKFNGYTTEQIEETYKEIFIKGNANIKYFLKSSMKNIFKNNLNFREIDNKFYEAKSLKIIHQAIAKELTDYIQVENDYLLGMSSYLMRKYFYEIHELMAIELIKCIHEKNVNANSFLLFYNGKTMLIDNKKYIIPSLETKDGKQWNNSSLIGICNLWMNTKKRKEQYEHKLVDNDMKIEEMNKKLAYIQPEKKLQEQIIKETEKKAESIFEAHSELEKKLDYLEKTSLNSTEFFVLEAKVTESKIQVDELNDIINEAKANLKAIIDANQTTFTDLESYTLLKNKLIQDVKVQNLNVDSKSAQMDPIIESIVKVLMDRTRLMK